MEPTPSGQLRKLQRLIAVDYKYSGDIANWLEGIKASVSICKHNTPTNSLNPLCKRCVYRTPITCHTTKTEHTSDQIKHNFHIVPVALLGWKKTHPHLGTLPHNFLFSINNLTKQVV